MARLSPKNVNGGFSYGGTLYDPNQAKAFMGASNTSNYNHPLPKGSAGPAGPQGPNGLYTPPTAGAQPGPGSGKPGPNAMQLQAAYDAFHPQAPAAAPAAPDYSAMFQESLNRQRGQIDATLRQVLGDVDVRRAQAAQVVAMQPGEVNKNYDQGQKAVGAQADAATKSLAQAGATAPTAGQQAGVDTIRAAMEASRANALGDQPYLTMGTNDLFNRQAGAAHAAAQGAYNDIESQRTGFYAQQAGAQLARQAEKEDGESATAERFRLQQAEEQRGLLQARSATRAGTPRWWEANAMADPEGAQKMSENFNIDPSKVQTWKKDPKAWAAVKANLTPALVSFLRFQYGLK